MGRRDFIQVLQRIAQQNDLLVNSWSYDWVIQFTDRRTGRRASVFGYTFDINPAAGVEICKEKAATSIVLQQHRVPCVHHEAFLSPAHKLSGEYVPPAGNWDRIRELAQQYNNCLVIKPLKGTGGGGVMRTHCPKDVEASVQLIFQSEYGLVISPFIDIENEYRCILIDGETRIAYRKVRIGVTADGQRTAAQLAAQELARRSALTPRELAMAAKAITEMSRAELGRVPAAGEEVVLQWRHNLGHGAASDCGLDDATRGELYPLAAAAQAAVGLRFCSVDIVRIAGEGLKVLEVNSGVMMDNFIEHQEGTDGAAAAYRTYEDAVLRMLRPAGSC
eukprot:TRINITY_DN65258_c0_g1_i1.p1 TRINITY_DN65258_c0_g1~~TRINITY_DN65258_c0_g1_i1.p1  ORF type:complete len:334 (+),score=95.66 TRINITY_DN65258_c0_g1_i1:79-1080(+)